MNAIAARTVVSALFSLIVAAWLAGPAAAQSQRLMVVVNDQPITDYDIEQRMRLNQVLGNARGSEAQQRKEALQELIDDVIKKAEAKRSNIEPDDRQINEAIEKMARNIGTTVEGLSASLKSKGVALSSLRQYVKATIAFNWIANRNYNISVKVDPGEIDRRFASLSSDPRFKPVLVYEIQEIALPVEETTESMAGQLFYARAIEAQQIIQRYRGCDSAKAAASGIFNVQISRTVQAPADQLPKDMKEALDKTGPGKILGPMRSSRGIQLIGFCGRRNIEPPKPTREMVESMLMSEKYQMAAQRILRELRRSAFIDYKDTSLTQ